MKIVITGAPNSGKTTLVNKLKEKGYIIFPEIARMLLEQNENYQNLESFQKKILEKTLERNKKINGKKITFLDIDVLEGIAYFKLNKTKPPEWLLKEAEKASYDKVFFLEKNPTWINDGVRFHTKKEAREIKKLIKQTYEEFGFKVIKVPWTSVEERIKFIEENIKKGSNKMQVDFELIKKEAKPFFKGVNGSHDWFHIERVFNLTRHICQKENADFKIAGTAALLHDISREDEEKGLVKDHAKEGAIKAKKILKKLGYEDKFADEVAYCIKVHRFSKGIKPETKEAEILQDADRLDVLGAIGIARVFDYGGRRDKPLYSDEEINEKREYNGQSDSSLIHFYEKILRIKPESFNTKTAQEIAKKRYEYTKKFTNKFLKEWKGEE